MGSTVNQPITTDGMASRMSGKVTTQGLSCRCSRVCSSMRSWPWNVMNTKRKLYSAVMNTPASTQK